MSKKNIYIEIGLILRKFRETKGLTQIELALKLGYQSPQFVSLFERGLSKVPMETLGQLSVFLNIPDKKIIALILKEYESDLKMKINTGKKQASTSI